MPYTRHVCAFDARFSLPHRSIPSLKPVNLRHFGGTSENNPIPRARLSGDAPEVNPLGAIQCLSMKSGFRPSFVQLWPNLAIQRLRRYKRTLSLSSSKDAT